MLVFSLTAVPLIACAFISRQGTGFGGIQGNRWAFYNGALFFLPLAMLMALVLAAPVQVLSFPSLFVDILFRDFLIPLVFITVVILFLPVFGRKHLDPQELSRFLAIFWTLCSLQAFVIHYQAQDIHGLFIVPLVLALFFPPMVQILKALLTVRGHWWFLLPLLVLVGTIASSVRSFWLLVDLPFFVLFLLLLLALAVLSFYFKEDELIKKLAPLPTIIPTFHKRLLAYARKTFTTLKSKIRKQ